MSNCKAAESRVESVLTDRLGYTGKYRISSSERQDVGRLARSPQDYMKFRIAGAIPSTATVHLEVERANPLTPAQVSHLRTVASNMDAEFDYRAVERI